MLDTTETKTRLAGINTRALYAINLMASTEDTRYYLNGVWLTIEPEHITYVATDGHILAAYREESKGEAAADYLAGSWIIPSSVCKALKTKQPYAPMREASAGQLEIDGQIFNPVDGTYPDWRRLVPSPDSLAPLSDGKAFDPRLLVQCMKMHAAFKGNKLSAHDIPNIYTTGAGPAILRWADEPDLFGLIMPRRQDKASYAPVGWL